MDQMDFPTVSSKFINPVQKSRIPRSQRKAGKTAIIAKNTLPIVASTTTPLIVQDKKIEPFKPQPAVLIESEAQEEVQEPLPQIEVVAIKEAAPIATKEPAEITTATVTQEPLPQIEVIAIKEAAPIIATKEPAEITTATVTQEPLPQIEVIAIKEAAPIIATKEPAEITTATVAQEPLPQTEVVAIKEAAPIATKEPAEITTATAAQEPLPQTEVVAIKEAVKETPKIESMPQITEKPISQTVMSNNNNRASLHPRPIKLTDEELTLRVTTAIRLMDRTVSIKEGLIICNKAASATKEINVDILRHKYKQAHQDFNTLKGEVGVVAAHKDETLIALEMMYNHHQHEEYSDARAEHLVKIGIVKSKEELIKSEKENLRIQKNYDREKAQFKAAFESLSWRLKEVETALDQLACDAGLKEKSTLLGTLSEVQKPTKPFEGVVVDFSSLKLPSEVRLQAEKLAEDLVQLKEEVKQINSAYSLVRKPDKGDITQIIHLFEGRYLAFCKAIDALKEPVKEELHRLETLYTAHVVQPFKEYEAAEARKIAIPPAEIQKKENEFHLIKTVADTNMQLLDQTWKSIANRISQLVTELNYLVAIENNNGFVPYKITYLVRETKYISPFDTAYKKAVAI